MSISLHKMTYKKPRIFPCVVNAIFLLFLLYPQILIAETNTAIDNVRAQKILESTPKNSEEFLARLEILLHGQDNTGLNFAKKLTGIGLEKWKWTNIPSNNKDFYRYYSFNLWQDGLWKDINVDKWPPFDKRPVINFWPSLTVDDYTNNTFFSFQIRIDPTRKVDHFSCITPEITIKYLGKPLKILSYIDDKTENSNNSQLVYRYKINKFKIRFQYEFNAGTPSAIIYNSNLLEDFNNHKDFCASKITVSRPNPFKLQRYGVGSKFVQEISAKIPQNANEFLRRIKSSWKNKNNNMSAFAEETTGVSLSKWMKTQNEEAINYYIFIPLCDLEDYPDFPYLFWVSLEANNSLFSIRMRYIKNQGAKYKHEVHPIVCITPSQTKDILGEPSTITGNDHRTMEGRYSDTKYLYKNEHTTLEFIYPNPDGYSKRYIDFKQHKNFCAKNIEIRTK